MKHDWVVAAISVIVAVAINVIIYAYAQGKLEHRVETLELYRTEMRAEWQTARDRIERALKEIQPKEK